MGFLEHLTYHFVRDVQRETRQHEQEERKFFLKNLQNCGIEVSNYGLAVLDVFSSVVGKEHSTPDGFNTESILEVFLFCAASISQKAGLREEQLRAIELIENHAEQRIIERFKRSCRSGESLLAFYPDGYLTEEDCGRCIKLVLGLLQHLSEPDTAYQNLRSHLQAALTCYCYCGNPQNPAQELCSELLFRLDCNYLKAKAAPKAKITYYESGTLQEHFDTVQTFFLEIANKGTIRSMIHEYDLMTQYLWLKTIYDIAEMGVPGAAGSKEVIQSLYNELGLDVGISINAFFDLLQDEEMKQFFCTTYEVHNNEIPTFWLVVQNTADSVGRFDEVASIYGEYRHVVLHIMAAFENAYPKQGYDPKKANAYVLALLNAVKNAFRS